ncbi:hypothetical protein ACIPY6_22865 [Streptomyces sp. NPDC090054]|uniref:hypothetical protein n=1 Tax=Streptomyces sp. NPDC090054 TaxID=3365933 RepID=UPI0037F9F787
MTTSTPRTAFLGEPDPPAPTERPAPEGRPPRRAGRTGAAVLGALLGIGLLAGAAATAWSEHRDARRPLPPDAAYRQAASLWRSAPVDSLLPPRVDAADTGPGGADRSWTRTALAPDADCGTALAADWRAALAAAGCTRVLRATYTDSTRSSLVTVGLVFTPADSVTMDGLRGRLPAPPAYAYADTRRAAWSTTVVAGVPALVYTVSAFADGRAMDAPVPAEEAAHPSASGIVTEAGLGHDAKALAARFERTLSALGAPPAPSAAPTAEDAR